jgi:hypothetical protein
MHRRTTQFLTFLLAIAVASPALADKTMGFEALGDLSDRVPAEESAENKGLLDCSNATPVVLDQTYTGDTNNGVNNVSTYSCSFFDESGPELVYELTLAEPANFTVNLIPEAGVDLDLAVLDQCDEDLGCLIVADAGVSTNTPQSGTIYFVVDGYNGAAGSFTLEFIRDPDPEPIDACERVEQPLPGEEGDVLTGVFPISGNTCGSPNTVEFLDCADFAEAGADNWYEIVLLPDASIDAAVTSSADGALWILDACSEPLNCLAYGDATLTGETEVVSYTNDTGSTQVVYLVVDSYGTDTCGDFTGEITINPPGVVDTEPASWGGIKSKF